MVGSVQYGSRAICYEVRFLASRRTLGIEVHPDGRVMVRAPESCPSSVIAERVLRRAGWISRQLAEFDQYRPRTPPRQFLRGESHLYLGRQYRLQVEAGARENVSLARGRMRVVAPDCAPEHVRMAVERWYRARARSVFAQILDQVLDRVNAAERPRLALRVMRSRWGSLSPRGLMTLNLMLIRAPRACIEYVVVHELCHQRFARHDAAFYRQLQKLMPDWERRKRRLEAALL